jgi:hypothetical protein
MDWQQDARSRGFGVPSWDASPGGVAPGLCVLRGRAGCKKGGFAVYFNDFDGVPLEMLRPPRSAR